MVVSGTSMGGISERYNRAATGHTVYNKTAAIESLFPVEVLANSKISEYMLSFPVRGGFVCIISVLLRTCGGGRCHAEMLYLAN